MKNNVRLTKNGKMWKSAWFRKSERVCNTNRTEQTSFKIENSSFVVPLILSLSVSLNQSFSFPLLSPSCLRGPQFLNYFFNYVPLIINANFFLFFFPFFKLVLEFVFGLHV